MKNLNGYIIAIVLLAIAVIGLGSYIAYDKVQENKESKTELKENKNEQNENTSENKYEIYDINNSRSVYTDDNISIRLTHDDRLIIDNNEVATNITYADKFTFSGSDTCYGNSWILMIDESQNVKAISIDQLVCATGYLTPIDITKDLQNLGVKTVKTFYQTNTYSNEYEPLHSKVYAVTDNDKIIEITSILSGN